jgi:hypothetical protein
MGFTSGSKILADIVEEIANGLIAAGNWSNITSYDSGATMWTTANKTGDNAKRALRYLNGSEEIFLSMTVTNNHRNHYPGYYSKGIEIVFSQSWDSVTHNYPSSNYMTHVLIETHSGGVSADMATLQIQYYLWIESNGFVLNCKPEPHPGDNSQQSLFLVVERNPNKEYTDGYSNFYLMSINNIWETLWGWDGRNPFISCVQKQW